MIAPSWFWTKKRNLFCLTRVETVGLAPEKAAAIAKTAIAAKKTRIRQSRPLCQSGSRSEDHPELDRDGGDPEDDRGHAETTRP